MERSASRWPRLPDRLGTRLGLLLSVALLPVGLIAVVMTLEVAEEARDNQREALAGLTAEAVALRQALIVNAFGAASTLGPLMLQNRADPEACTNVLSELVQGPGLISFAAYLGPDGRAVCATGRAPIDLSDHPAFVRFVEQPRPTVVRLGQGAATASSVIGVLEPVLNENAFAGAVLIAMPERLFNAMRRYSNKPAPRQTVIFNVYGEIVSSSPDLEQAMSHLPVGIPLADLARPDDTVFHGETVAGETATFVVEELISRRAYALAVWPPDAIDIRSPIAYRSALVFPLLMWAVSLAVAYFALHRLVIRHIRQLGNQMRRFAIGYRDENPAPLNGAAAELRDLSNTYSKLTRIIQRDEARLESSLQEKTMLLREVHHRVKNNLQLITSIINMQIRKSASPESERVLRAVQDRVMSLAMIHQSLYQSDDLSDLRADELIRRIFDQIIAVGLPPGTNARIETELEPMRLDSEQAVPLSLLIGEATTNALKYLGTPPGAGIRPWLQLRLAREGSRGLRFEMLNSIGAQEDRASGGNGSTALGSQLIEAFAMQLDGTIETGSTDTSDGPAWRLALTIAPARGEAATG